MPGERILIVDDKATNLKLVAYLMKAHGYTAAAFGKWHLGVDWATKDGKEVANCTRVALMRRRPDRDT